MKACQRQGQHNQVSAVRAKLATPVTALAQNPILVYEERPGSWGHIFTNPDHFLGGIRNPYGARTMGNMGRSSLGNLVQPKINIATSPQPYVRGVTLNQNNTINASQNNKHQRNQHLAIFLQGFLKYPCFPLSLYKTGLSESLMLLFSLGQDQERKRECYMIPILSKCPFQT